MAVDYDWAAALRSDTQFGYVDRATRSPRQLHPQVVLNSPSGSMLRVLREELRHCRAFSFSVAFVSPRAIALLKQELLEFSGKAQIITSDYLGFNSPRAFAELHNLTRLGIEARLHNETSYHPKGYVFEYSDRVTAILGSSNLTESALVKNHEWNLKVSAAHDADLAGQLRELVAHQHRDSVPLTPEWIESYAQSWVAPSARPKRARLDEKTPTSSSAAPATRAWPIQSKAPLPAAPATEISITVDSSGPFVAVAPKAEPNLEHLPATPLTPAVRSIQPNRMQSEALLAIDALRRDGKKRAMVISATGTGKTILSALDVRAVNPRRMLFVVHREQILDRAIQEFQRVLGASPSDFGKLAGSHKQVDRRYVFATVQTLSRWDILHQLDPAAFDYILIDEVHRAGASSYARVIDHFKPAFLVGMTATPERTDSFNIFELFDYNVAYEIRLNRALEDGMLSPFHYYGVADAKYSDGTTTTDFTGLTHLASRLRVDHIVRALEDYGQAGIQPRGLIFCSRKDEAHALSAALNGSLFRNRNLRTVALTGDDSIEHRERVVAQLEAGELDYVLTVDVFNEGVDIPSVNQVVLLRQTRSAIVFVQQLGRGLRLHDEKEYLVVIDFIGNYTNNYLIPIALFGDESLNKESLRKNLIAAEESGVLPGLSSVRFDRISQERVMRSITETKLDSMANLKSAIETLSNRLGRTPSLHDFLRFDSVDPVLLATKLGNYPALIEKLTKKPSGLSTAELDALTLLSAEALASKRQHELLTVRALIERGSTTIENLRTIFQDAGIEATRLHAESAIRSLNLAFHTEAEQTKYKRGILSRAEDVISLTPAFRASYKESTEFASMVDDLIITGLELITDRYDKQRPFTPGRQYSRKDACRLLCWDKNVMATIYGYKVDKRTLTCPIFVTYHKSDEIAASTAYEDELLDNATMRWYTRSRRTLESDEVATIVNRRADVFVFAKKSDAEGSDFYFLGAAEPSNAKETKMRDGGLDVVRMDLSFNEPIESAVYDYFHPVIVE